MSISPIVALAGIQAAAQVVQTGITSLTSSFEQLLAKSPTADPATSLERTDALAAPSSGRSWQLAEWANRQAFQAHLQEVGDRIREVLQQTGVPFDAPIDVTLENGELQVDANNNPLPAQLETELVLDPSVRQLLEGLARFVPDLSQPLAVRVAPDGSVGVLNPSAS